jgi:hypothetical protein
VESIARNSPGADMNEGKQTDGVILSAKSEGQKIINAKAKSKRGKINNAKMQKVRETK